MADAMIVAVRDGSSKFSWGASHLAGALTTSASLGFGLGALGALAGIHWQRGAVIFLCAIAVLYALREAIHLPLPIPEARRQVPAWWQTFYPPPVAAFLYGAGLGVGFATYLGYGTLVVVAASAIVSGSPIFGVAAFGTFGVARALAAIAVASRAEPPDLDRPGWILLLSRLNAVVLALVAVVGAVVAIGGLS